MKQKSFELLKVSSKNEARLGVLSLNHGKVKTPFFMPIATRGSVKTLTSAEIEALGAEIILANSYHLYLKPGLKVIKKLNGLPNLINWSKPILTDSGGFQVFSLKEKAEDFFKNRDQNESLVKVTDKGVEFRSVYDGSKHFFTASSVVKMQAAFGSDVLMVLDQCVKNPATYESAKTAVKRTLAWARESLKAYHSLKPSKGRLFAIVQGSLFKDLREYCARELVKIGKNFSASLRPELRPRGGGPASGWDGYAVGGLAVGESPQAMYKVLDYTVRLLPQDKPRYLMGVGYPEQIIEAVKRGIDMFDCVIPTREARHGRLYFWKNDNLKGNFYKTENLTNQKFAKDKSPINSQSKIKELRQYSKGYLRHLFSVNEPLALRLATLNNLEFYLSLMAEIRQMIRKGKL